MNKDIAIVGGGIIGICSAYYLHKSGHKVSLFESNKIGKGSSYGNAGFIVPSHYSSIANPAMLKKGIKWMLNPNSPFFLKPRFDLDLIKWLIKFTSFCTTKHVNNNKHFLRDINLYSLDLFKELKESSDFDFNLQFTGLLNVCKEERSLQEQESFVNEVKELGLEAKILNRDELKKLEPNISLNAVGASYLKDDATIQPYDFIIAMKNYLEKEGVKFYEDCQIEDICVNKSKVTSIVDQNSNVYNADSFIFAAGVFTKKIVQKLDFNIPMEGGKGFSFIANKTDSLNFSTPMLLVEEKVAVTPYDSYVRFGGTMIMDGHDLSINKRRVNNIRKIANSYINGLDMQEHQMKDIWAGLRPCSPDGLPYVGRSKKFSNVIVATGHAMKGISIGPATGKIVADLIDDRRTEINIDKMNPYRFNGKG